MCWADKCCFCIKIDTGSVIIGFVSLILSTAMIATSAVFFSMVPEEAKIHPLLNSTPNVLRPVLTKLFTLVVTPHQRTVLLCSALAMGLLLMFASVMLMIGISKKKPGLILVYFGLGTFFVIFTQLGAILLLLENHWAASLVIFFASGIYIHFLVVIHTLYDQMQRKMHDLSTHEILIEEDTVSIASQDTGIITL